MENMKSLKKNQVVIFVIALMLMTAGYLNYTNKNISADLIPTSSLADSEEMASIGDATLVSAKQASENQISENTKQENNQINNPINTNEKSNNFNTESVLVESNEKKQNETDNDYFAQSRLDREKMYSQMIENYQKILETDKLDTEEKKNAQNEITRINNEKNAIMIAENLIKTKGFSDIIIFVNNGNVTVVVETDKLGEEQIAQIQNIITRELGVKTNKINISKK